MATTAVDIVVKTSGQQRLERLNKQLGKTSTQADRVGKSLQGLSSAFGKLGLALGGAGLVSSYFKGFAEASKAKAAVKSLGVDVSELEGELRRVSVESGNLASTTELLAASYDVASAGFGDAADNAKILDVSLKGAVGGMSDLATVSDATTSVLNAYGLSADKAGKLVDGFIQTQNDGKIVVDQYARNIGRLAPIAAAAGVSIEEVNAAIATVTAQGVPIEATFTGLRQGISSILKPSKEAQDLAKQLGIEFNEQALRAKGLGGVLADVRQKTNGSQTAMTTLFGSVEALTALLPLTSDNLEKYNDNLDNQITKTGQAEDATKDLGGTVTTQVQRIVNGIGNIARTLDTVLGPALKRILGTLNDIIIKANQALDILSDAQLGAAAQKLAEAATKLTFGFEADALNTFAEGLSLIDPALAKSEDQLNRYRQVIQRFSEQLKRIPASSPLADQAVELQGEVFKLLRAVEAAEKKLRAAAKNDPLNVETKDKPKDDPITELTEPKKLAPLDTLFTPKGLEAIKTKTQQQQIANQLKLNDAISAGNKDLIKSLEIEKRLIPLKVREEALRQGLAQLANETQQYLDQGYSIEQVRTIEARFQKDLLETQNALRLTQLGITGDQLREEKAITDEKRNQANIKAVGKGFAAGAEADQQLTDQARELDSLYKGIGQTIQTGIVDAIATGIEGLIKGTKDLGDSLQEIASGILSDIGRQLISFGVKTAFGSLLPGFAEGGRPPVGAVSIVGERGPELFVPDQPGRIISNRDSKAAMSRYTPANNIQELVMQGSGRGKSDWGYSTEESYQPVINISTGNTLQFEGRNYVTQEEFQAGVSKAAIEGAKAGEARTLRRLRMSPGARRNVGF